jgi:predicted neuraminidase
LLCILALLVTAPASAEELRPVEYRHPGLHVDLGVGLWAWPVPVDFDGDGDLDLIVSCPDKPYNGTYVFENPAGRTKLPVFKPARRLSRGLPNISPSYDHGRLRVLGPGVEYSDFAAAGLDHPHDLPLPTNIHAAKVRANQWKYVDFDGDQKLDLVVGVGDWTDYGWDDAFDAQGHWTHGPLHGYVYLLHNRSTNDKPDYEQPRKVEADTRPIDTFGMPSPNFADFDGDGDLDLLCGEFLDGFTYFENTGSRREPVYAVGRRLTYEGRPLAMDLEMIVPVAIDWDRDGDTDLIVGDEDGRVALVENTGRIIDRLPQFLPPQYFQQEADEVKCGALATPVGFDWDGDGDDDLISGNSAGYITFFENMSGRGVERPQWAAPVRLTADGQVIRIQAGPSGSIQGPAEAKWGYTTLSIADWDGDRLPDLIVNSIWGRVVWYRNTGTRTKPKLSAAEPIKVAWSGPPPKPSWTWWQPGEGELATQWRTTPVARDVDGDGLTDLVMLDQEGYLALFRRRRVGDQLELLPPERVFLDESGQPLKLARGKAGKSGRRKLCLVDWDGDGRLDLLLDSRNVNWYRNVAQRPGQFVLRDMGPLDSRVLAGHDTSPTTVDFNGDGRPDLLVGAEDGHFYYQRHAAAASAVLESEFIYESAPFAQCHATTIAETGHGLVAAWFGGTREGHPDVSIWMSHREASGWTPPVRVADGVVSGDLRYPCWNPVLFQPRSGPLMLFYKVGPSPQQWWGLSMTSTDGGRTWSAPRRLPDGILGPIKNKPVQLADGTILCPTSSESPDKPSKWRVYFDRTTDAGQTWELIGPINDGLTWSAIQPSILRHGGDTLQAVGRSRQGKVFQSWSPDAGKTWGPMTATSLPNPNSGTDAVTLADGRQLLVYNHTASGRHPLNVAASADGKIWQAALVLESEPGEYSYPAVIQTADHLVHITYTWKRQRVKHTILDPGRLSLQPITGGVWPK